MKIVIISFISIAMLIAQNKLEIKAGHISYKNQKVILKNNVNIKEGVNTIKMQKATILLKNNNIVSFSAVGEVSFLYTDNTKQYNIKTDNIFFNAKKNEYTLNGQITLEDNMSNKIQANKVIINKSKNIFIIEGDEQPVSLEFIVK